LKNGVWEGTATVGGREEFKFRANSDWGINLGDDKGDNSLEYGGANIVLPGAGTYKLSLDLTNPWILHIQDQQTIVEIHLMKIPLIGGVFFLKTFQCKQ